MVSSSSSSSPPLRVQALLFLSCSLPFLAVVEGWGTLGHEIVANIAWNRLIKNNNNNNNHNNQHNATIIAWIEDILGPQNHTEEAGSPLAAVADWADRVRHFKPWSGPLHYIDVRDDLYKGGCHYNNNNNNNSNSRKEVCSFDYERDCPDDICVAGAILNYTSQLVVDHQPSSLSPLRGGKSEPDSWAKSQALRFVTHFIGDIHQPLHCSRTTDKGGNDYHVHFNFNLSVSSPSRRDLRRSSSSKSHSHSWNLHSVWDTGIIEVALQRDYQNSRVNMETDLFQQSFDNENDDEYLKCGVGLYNKTCTEIWGQESFGIALQYAYHMDESGGTEVEDGSTITEEYYETRLPIVKDRLIAAGVRLAATLEAIYNETVIESPPGAKGITQNEEDEEDSTLVHALSNLRLGFALY